MGCHIWYHYLDVFCGQHSDTLKIHLPENGRNFICGLSLKLLCSAKKKKTFTIFFQTSRCFLFSGNFLWVTEKHFFFLDKKKKNLEHTSNSVWVVIERTLIFFPGSNAPSQMLISNMVNRGSMGKSKMRFFSSLLLSQFISPPWMSGATACAVCYVAAVTSSPPSLPPRAWSCLLPPERGVSQRANLFGAAPLPPLLMPLWLRLEWMQVVRQSARKEPGWPTREDISE